MQWIIIPLIVVAAGFVLFSLARGLYYFTKSGKAVDSSAGENGGPSEMQLMQNKMMVARIKWQAITIILLVIMGLFAASK